VSITHNTKPTTYLGASKVEHWKKAMNIELDALTKTGTWKIVYLPLNIQPIGRRWVYKVKYRSNGSIERYNARLVAKGYTQLESLNFYDTFSPIAKSTTVRMLLALVATMNWNLRQLDVNNAFLQGEDAYMAIPKGYCFLEALSFKYRGTYYDTDLAGCLDT
jgi:hypothetical protein